MLLVVPVVLLTLLKFVFEGQASTFQAIGAPMCGLFPFVIMFLITSIAMLRERTTGTLERLMTLPMGKLDLLVGYGLAFGILARSRRSSCARRLPRARPERRPRRVAGRRCSRSATRCSGWRSGSFVSAFARTEFQAVQFMPALILPQLLLCGLFIERSEMADRCSTGSRGRFRSPTPTTRLARTTKSRRTRLALCLGCCRCHRLHPGIACSGRGDAQAQDRLSATARRSRGTGRCG